jgi:hypothetical protein
MSEFASYNFGNFLFINKAGSVIAMKLEKEAGPQQQITADF